MHQTKEGNQRSFEMIAHIGIDVEFWHSILKYTIQTLIGVSAHNLEE
jgi:hypothetical protein